MKDSKKKIKSLDWSLYPEFENYKKRISYPVPIPTYGWLEVSTFCNIQCKHCFMSQKGFIENYQENPNCFMEMSVFEIWCKKILPHIHGVSLEGSAGEPFLHPEIERIISRIISSKTLPCMVTNGTILKEKTIKKIFKAGGRIIVSLDGINEDTYNKIRKGGNFTSLWNNILKMLSMKEKTKGELFINTVYQRDNCLEIESLIEKCLLIGVDKILIHEHMPVHFSYPEMIDLFLPPEGVDHIKNCFKKYWNHGKVFFNFFTYHMTRYQLNSCCSPWIHIWTGVKGNARICCIGDEKFWGNISENILSENFDLLSFINKKELVNMRKNILEGKFPEICRTCHLIWGINNPYLNYKPMVIGEE